MLDTMTCVIYCLGCLLLGIAIGLELSRLLRLPPRE